MKEDFFDNQESADRSRDGYMSRDENEQRSMRQTSHAADGRPSRPRFSRESRVGGSNFRKANFVSETSSYGHYGSYTGRRSDESLPQRRFFSPHPSYGDRPGDEGVQSRRESYRSDNRWSKQRTGYAGAERMSREGYASSSRENYGAVNRFSRYDNAEGYRPGGSRPRFNRYDGSSASGYNGRPGQPRSNGFKPKNNRFAPKKRQEYKEEVYDPNQPVRLNKFLANAGVCSRRDADKYIQAGVVSVNGEIITELGHKVLRTDTVLFHDNAVTMEKKQYVLLNKPKGYVTTVDDPQNRKTVMDLVRNACPERIYPVGRLDRNTTGVLLLTNDGEMASRLTHPKFLKKKIYHVTTDRNVAASDLRQIAEGITLTDGDIKADAVEYASETDKKQIGIEIHSGKNRIVRRIFEHLGYHVIKLDRVYFAGLTKKNVRRGDWRYLTEKEVNMLRMGAYE